jgi:hypothetical protein
MCLIINEGLRNMYASREVTRENKCGRIGWAVRVTSMEECYTHKLIRYNIKIVSL